MTRAQLFCPCPPGTTPRDAQRVKSQIIQAYRSLRCAGVKPSFFELSPFLACGGTQREGHSAQDLWRGHTHERVPCSSRDAWRGERRSSAPTGVCAQRAPAPAPLHSLRYPCAPRLSRPALPRSILSPIFTSCIQSLGRLPHGLARSWCGRWVSRRRQADKSWGY